MDGIKILIADRPSLIRDGLKTVLDSEEDMSVVGAVDTCSEACNIIDHLCPDVLIIDIQASENSLDIIKTIKKDYPQLIVIILTNLDNDEYITRALSYGANGYLLKNIVREKLIQTIRETVDGSLVIPSVIAVKLSARLKKLYEDSIRRENIKALGFSQREREIADLLVMGLSNKQIASKLYISEGTTKNYVSTIYNKVGVNDRTKAVIFLKEYVAC
jgi:DNA-binding NarL/FixJ family response regulator